jgi:hypothetical protein
MFWSVLSIVAGLANVVLAIMVLVKLFQTEGAGKGILGLICGLYTFIWGWMKHKELEITQIMTWWSILIVVNLIISAIASAQSY